MPPDTAPAGRLAPDGPVPADPWPPPGCQLPPTPDPGAGHGLRVRDLAALTSKQIG